MPDRGIVQDTGLAVHAVLFDILARYPPFRGQVGHVAGVQETVVAGVRQECFQREQQDGPDAGEEGNDDENDGYYILAGFADRDLAQMAGLAGDGRVVLPAL